MTRGWLIAIALMSVSPVCWSAETWTQWRNSLKPAGNGQQLKLVENGESRCRIVIPPEATTEEKKAADDLQHWVNEITGKELPVTSKAASVISISTNKDFADEEYEIANDGEVLRLTGGPGRGVINAVYALLEEDVGCRWYSKDDVRLPKSPTLTFDVVPRRYKSQLRVRDPFWAVAFDADWSLWNRTNAQGAHVKEEWGGYVDYGTMFVHTAAMLLPPDKYFREHPEYFMLDKGGKRQAAQWCATDPNVAKIVTAAVLEALKKNPHIEIISVSKNDSGGDQLCQCERCTKLRDAEGGAEMATQLFLVNQVAEAVEKQYPSVAIDTLAYLDTIAVPKTVRPRKNVVIRLCNDAVGAWVRPFTPAAELPVAKIAEAWAAACNRIYIWDYHVNFSHYLAPMPNVEVIAGNIRFWLKNHAEGVMLQAAYQSTAERDWLKSWVSAKLLWDPTRDENALVQDFIWGVYGKAAPAIAEYDALLVKAGKDHAKELASPPGGIRYEMNNPFLSKEFLDQATGIFGRAKQLAAGDEKLLHKVECAELPIMYVKLSRGPEFVGESYGALLDGFERIGRREGVKYLAEGSADFEPKVAAFRKLVPAATTKPAQASGPMFKNISQGAVSGSYQAFPDACRLKNGDILCVFYAGYGHVSLPAKDCPLGGRICMTRSSDEGKTWSEPQVLFDDADDNRDSHIAQLDDGTVVCTFFSWHMTRPMLEKSSDFSWKTFSTDAKIVGASMVVSHDDGRTWESVARPITSSQWVCSAPVRQLSDGTCVLGLYGEDPKTKLGVGAVIRSVDRCRTWEAPVAIDPASGVDLDAETDVIRLHDGSLFAALRSSKLNMHYATSSDEGKTWSNVKDIGFKGHAPHLNRLSTGEILLAHRVPNTAVHVSRDDGKSWQGPYEIDGVGGAYPSTVELKDKSVLIVYYTEGAGSHVRAKRFRVKADGIEMLPL